MEEKGKRGGSTFVSVPISGRGWLRRRVKSRASDILMRRKESPPTAQSKDGAVIRVRRAGDGEGKESMMREREGPCC